MKSLIFFMLFFFLSLFSFCTAAAVPNYQYMKFAQQWQPGVCRSGLFCKRTAQAVFSVHGLWPSNFTKSSSPCTGSAFNRRMVLEKFGTELDIYWPDLLNGYTNVNFWSNEWSKHGTCSEQVFSQFEYFEKVIDLAESTKLLNILKGAGPGYTPSNKKKVDSSQMAIDLGKTIGGSPELICNGKNELVEIRICYTVDAKSKINCPGAGGGNCQGYISFY